MENKYEFKDDYIIIYITNRKGEVHESYIDKEDYDKTKNHSWYITYRKALKGYYVRTTVYEGIINGKPKYSAIYLHRLIADAYDGFDVDHINHIPYYNRKSNLKIKPHKSNAKNRKSKNSNNKSGYRNVCWVNKDQKWYVQLQINGKNTCLKKFNYEDVDLAGAYAEEMRTKYYGEHKGNS